MRLPFLILALLSAAVADAVELRNELGEDQRSETIRVEIDGHAVGVLRVDGKRKQAAGVRLPTNFRCHERIRGGYRLERMWSLTAG